MSETQTKQNFVRGKNLETSADDGGKEKDIRLSNIVAAKGTFLYTLFIIYNFSCC